MKSFASSCVIVTMVIAGVMLLLPSTVVAQVDTGVIQGTVRDTTGGVVPGASVTLLNVDMGVSFQTKTNEVGLYQFPSVRIGNYTLVAEASGFAPSTRDGISLSIQQRYVGDFSLKPSNIAETVNVIERCGAAPDTGGLARRRRAIEDHQRSSVERPQLHVPRAAERRRRPGAAGHARHGRQWQLLGQRPEQLRQQLPARRRRQQLEPGRLRQRRGLCVPALGRRAAGVQGSDEQLQRRAGTLGRRRAECQPQIGRRSVSAAICSNSIATRRSTRRTSSTSIRA